MFDLTQYTKVYAPTLSDSPKEIELVHKEKIYPIKLVGSHVVFTKNGKYSVKDPNPAIFPYSQEWYDKLKSAYPNLEPYKDEVENLLNLLEQRIGNVACKVSRESYEDAIKNNVVVFKGSVYQANGIYFVPVNPFTLKECKTVEDYFIIPSNI